MHTEPLHQVSVMGNKLKFVVTEVIISVVMFSAAALVSAFHFSTGLLKKLLTVMLGSFSLCCL
jgi:hypothetical protein